MEYVSAVGAARQCRGEGCGGLPDPPGHGQEDPAAGGGPDQVIHEFPRRGVSPMQVVDGQHQTTLAQACEERGDRTMQPQAGSGARAGRLARGLPDAVQRRVQFGEGRVSGQHAGADIGQRVGESLEREVLFVLRGPAAKHRESGLAALAQTSLSNRLLPMPGSPAMSTTAGVPGRSRPAIRASSRASSVDLPTSCATRSPPPCPHSRSLQSRPT